MTKCLMPFAEQFRSPPPECRGAPFWSWNDELDEAKLLRQIGWLEEMGFGGFHMHARTGLALEYLGPAFMDRVRVCVEEAARRGLRAWLYDEDRWPSGYGGGLVTVDSQYRQRYLLFTPRPYGPTPPVLKVPSMPPVYRNERGRLLARYEIRLENGGLAHCRRLADGEEAGARNEVWYAYVEVDWPCIGYNDQTLADLMNPKATRRFIEVTHERYRQAVGKHFGGVVPAIFTDEPHPAPCHPLPQAKAREDLRLPFTDDFPATYRAAYGADLLDTLPEIVWDLPDGRASVTRWRYHDHLAERIVTDFLEPLHDWCATQGIALTGHLVEEPTLQSQTTYDGEVMRGYRAMQFPGMDLVEDGLQLNTAKQVQSAAHQFGRPGVLSELYGCTGWDFSFANFKSQGDWQAALGVTQRVPHLSWVSMRGEAKRDCPGSIFYQQPWWREWRWLEDHYARLNVVLGRGRPVVHVGVIHPIESFWLSYGPAAETCVQRDRQEQQFRELTEWLLGGLVDFDFIAESLLPTQAGGGTGFRVGEMTYDVVIVPPMRTIRSSTLERLEAFAEGGGTILFADAAPGLVDVVPSDRATQLAARCGRAPFAREAIVGALVPWGEVSVKGANGQPVYSLVSQIRQEGDDRYLFVCNTNRREDAGNTLLRLRGEWDVTWLDTMTGTTQSLTSWVEDGWTVLEREFPACGHLLARLTPRVADRTRVEPTRATGSGRPRPEVGLLCEPARIELSEPNVLLLDRARWRWNDEPWQPCQELRSIEDALDERYGLQVRRGYCAQPWSDVEPAPVLGRLTLEFGIITDIPVIGGQLAIEQPAGWSIMLDDVPVSTTDCGWWVDEAIRRLVVPSLSAGAHRLTLTIAFTRRTELEWLYVLGDFGVTLDGWNATVTTPVRTLCWGDWTRQGLPFYTGNVTYRCLIETRGGALALRAPPAPAPLLAVTVDGRNAGRIAFSPYRLDLGFLSAGAHEVEITAFGQRHNTFESPYRKDGAGYELQPMGVAMAPSLASTSVPVV